MQIVHSEHAQPPSQTYERVMREAGYAHWRKSLCAALRSQTDFPPLMVKPGKEDVKIHMKKTKERIDELRERGEEAVPIRGWRIQSIGTSLHDCIAWRAEFLVLVRRPEVERATNKACYECVSDNYNVEDSGIPFLFVPSAKAHAEVKDDSLFLFDYHPGVVFGGNKEYVEAVLQKFHGRVPCGRRAEDVKVWDFYYPDSRIMTKEFREWCALHWEGDRPQDVARKLAVPYGGVGRETKYKSPFLEIPDALRAAGEKLLSDLETIMITMRIYEQEKRCSEATKTKMRNLCRQSYFSKLDAHSDFVRRYSFESKPVTISHSESPAAIGSMFR